MLGVAQGDTEDDAAWMAEKVLNLRAFEDDAGKMNRSVLDVARGHPGRQPVHPAGRLPGRPPAQLHRRGRTGRGRAALSAIAPTGSPSGLEVATGVFRAMMKVELVNDGPVTFLLDSRKSF